MRAGWVFVLMEREGFEMAGKDVGNLDVVARYGSGWGMHE